MYGGLETSEDNMWVIKSTSKANAYFIAYPFSEGNTSYTSTKIYIVTSAGYVLSQSIYATTPSYGFRPVVAIRKTNS